MQTGALNYGRQADWKRTAELAIQRDFTYITKFHNTVHKHNQNYKITTSSDMESIDKRKQVLDNIRAKYVKQF